MNTRHTLKNRLAQALLNASWLRGSELLAAQIGQQIAASLPRLQPLAASHAPMWFGRRVLRVVGSVTIAGILNLTAYPLAMAVALPKNGNPAAWKSVETSADRQLVELIDNVRATLMSPADSVMRKAFDPQTTLERFDALAGEVLASMQSERELATEQAADRSPETVAQLDELKRQFETRSQAFRGKLQDMVPQGLLKKTAKSDGTDLNQWLDEVSPLKAPEDLTEMPFQTLKPDRNNEARDFEAEQKTAQKNQKAANLKAAPDFNDPQYLASTGEAEITADIKAKAQELNNSPVEIYNWVRNNVEWQPTWGGQQTADMTLDVKRGNAMDIATLTIALLRAANIPARYIHGTVDIPANQFRNMAGDFANTDAAWDFASAGGIPITGITSGGQISKLRIEHVWVEAAVPYYPARGAKPVSAKNPIDTWVPLDPSFKQYEYLNGLDTETIANIDGQQLANDFTNSGTVNEQEGWVQGLNPTIIENAQTQAQQKLETHIDQMQNPTVGDVIGGRAIKPQTLSYLPGSLPYPKTMKGNTYAQLPTALQTRVTLGLGWDRYDQDYIQSKTMPLYQLNQRNLTISFKPASTADENALKALIPESLTDPSQLPSVLPSSIRVIPEIKRDDETLLTTGSGMALGEEIDTGYHFQAPTQSYLNKRDSVIAGSYLALGVVGSNPSKKTFDRLKANLEQTKQVLETGTEAQKTALTRERVLGDMFVTGIQGYYAQYIAQSRVASLQSRTMHQPIPTAGTFGYEPYQRTLFGLNRGIEKHGMYMNVRTAQAVKDRQGDSAKGKQLMLQVGMLSSALEHSVPEQMFNDPNSATKPEGFSTAKALGLALAQGQKIYTINQTNKAQALSKLHLDAGAMSEINTALSSGKEVIAHTDQLTITGYKGSGYAITDPVTGEGVYKISGGKNGGYLEKFGLGVAIVGIIGALVGASAFFLIAIAIIAAFASLILFLATTDPCGDFRDDAMLGGVLAATVLSSIFGLLGKVGASIVSAISGWIYGTAITAALSASCR